MPAFGGRLTNQEITHVAAYVAAAAAKSPVSVAAAFKPDDTKLADCKARQRVLRAGVREPRLPTKGRSERSHCSTKMRPIRRSARLPPDRARDRRRRARVLQRETSARRSPTARRSAGRATTTASSSAPSPACPTERLARRGPRDSARAQRCGGRLHRLPVRPRARSRADDLHGLRPAARARDVRQARDLLGSDLVHRRRLHGEPPDVLRHEVPVAKRRQPALPVHDRRRAAQALLLPDGDVAHPRRRRRRLAEDGRVVPQGGAGLGGHVLPVARPGRVRTVAPGPSRRSSASARSPGTMAGSASTAPRGTSRAWTPGRAGRRGSARRRRRRCRPIASTASARSSAASRASGARRAAAARPCRRQYWNDCFAGAGA